MKYDSTDPKSIESYAKTLIGKTFLDVLDEQNYDESIKKDIILRYGNIKRKGGLGNFIEEIFFGYKANSNSEPDFKDAGVELKVSPYEITKKGSYKSGERLVITMIDYSSPITDDFKHSHLLSKMNLMLLIYYFRDSKSTPKLNFSIDYVSLYRVSEIDLKIIEDDYNTITNKIKDGKAHELSESDTMYLSACTKGATAKESLTPQFYNKTVFAKKRAYSFKSSYMSIVLNSIINMQSQEDIILQDASILKNQTFEEYVLNCIGNHIGTTTSELCDEFDISNKKQKGLYSILAYRMLGVKSNQAEEFLKANIKIKSIRIDKNGKNKEHISLPHFRAKELVNETWETSTIRKYFEETKFLFVVYKIENKEYVLCDVKFWNISNVDLDIEVRACWEETQSLITKGISFSHKVANNKSGYIITNNLPSKKNNRIMHVRPHSAESAYKLHNGVKFGNLHRDADELPDGQYMTKQSFWLNNSYIFEQLFK